MRPVPRKATLEEDEAVDVERIGIERGVALEKPFNLASPAASPAGEGDVRMERAVLRIETGGLARSFDLGGKGGELSLRLDSGPEGAGVALLEASDALNADLKAIEADAGQRVGQVIRHWTVNLAGKTQRQVQLLVIQPAKVRTVIHCVDEQVADAFRGADGNEQTVHRPILDAWLEAVTKPTWRRCSSFSSKLIPDLMDPIRGNRGEVGRKIVEGSLDHLLHFP